MVGPQRLQPGNFTPPSRTPWGGHRIVGKYKAAALHGVDPSAKVGESWEVSIEPSFPSVLDTGEPLADAIARDPVSWLGTGVSSAYGQSPLLVKLVDAATTLSVQVHPPEDHPLLKGDESGKTEAWIILDAEPDAVIYLGFQDGVTRAVVESYLTDGKSLEPLLNEVPVKPGDVFFIRPGSVHALGAGITVLEPQRVRPFRRSVTYRFWDWNRRYDENGTLDVNGRPRPLHVQEALAVTNWEDPRGDAFVQACRRRPVALVTTPSFTSLRVIEETELFVEDWTGTASSHVPHTGTLLGVLCLAGHVELASSGQLLTLHAGETAVIPAVAQETHASVDDARVMFCSVPLPSLSHSTFPTTRTLPGASR